MEVEYAQVVEDMADDLFYAAFVAADDVGNHAGAGEDDASDPEPSLPGEPCAQPAMQPARPPVKRLTYCTSLGLPAKAMNAAARLGIQTVGDLVRQEKEFYKSPGIGATTIGKVRGLLEAAARPMANVVSAMQLACLCRTSGNMQFVFDPFGVLVRVPEGSFAGEHGLDKLPDEAALGGVQAMTGIAELDLSDVVKSRLAHHGFKTVADLAARGPQAVLSLRGFGPFKLRAIAEAIRPYGVEWDVNGRIAVQAAPTPGIALGTDELMEQFEAGYSEQARAVRDEAVRRAKWFENDFDGDYLGIYALALAPEALDSCSGDVAAATDALLDRLLSMQCDGRDDARSVQGVPLRPVPRTAWEWAGTLPEKKARIVRARLEGMTLQKIGDLAGLTRERVRQIVAKEASRAPRLEEDRYRVLFERYGMRREEFCDLFGEEPLVWEYLDMRFERGKLPLPAVLVDPDIPQEQRDAVNARR